MKIIVPCYFLFAFIMTFESIEGLPIVNKCSNRTDGIYPLPDVFKYLSCYDGNQTIFSCPGYTMFIPDVKACIIPVEDLHKASFCTNRTSGQYRNPWNCRQFISCSHGTTFVMSCPVHLVYDPVLNRCDYPTINRCTQLIGILLPKNGKKHIREATRRETIV